jgi:hypothetical protein
LVVVIPGGGVLEETQETEELIGRVAALDIGKAELTRCVRVPSPGKRGRRAQEVRTYQTRPGRCWSWSTGCGSWG